MVVLTHGLSSMKVLFIITIACVLLLSSFFIVLHVYYDNISIDIQRDYHQISENVQSTDQNVSVIELSNKIMMIITDEENRLPK